MDCGALTDLTNGKANTSSGNIVGSVATFSCNTGYILSHHQAVVCGADGRWSSDSPLCNRKNFSTTKFIHLISSFIIQL